MMLASMFQFSFLCFVSLANLCVGFVIASWLGWGPALSALFEFGQPATLDSPAAPVEPAPEEQPTSTGS